MRRVDMTTTLLEGKVNGIVIIELPEGLDRVEKVEPNTVGQLNSELYGIPESSRRFYELLKKILKEKLNFET